VPVIPRPPGEAKTVREMFEYSCVTFADNVAFKRRWPKGNYGLWKYSEVHDYVKRFSGALLDMGVKKGDRIVILSDNRPEWGVAFFTITSIGAVAVPLDHLLAHSVARFAVAPASFTKSLLEVISRAPAIEKILSMEDPKGDGVVVGFEELLARGEASGRDYHEVDVGPDDLLSIVYTSGTTGNPKGVMITHGNLAFEAWSLNQLNPYSQDDVLLSLLPMNHLYEFVGGFFGPFACGGTVAFISSLLPSRIIEAFQECGVTRIVGVPLLFTLFYGEVGNRVEKLPAAQKFLFFRSLDVARTLRLTTGYTPGRILFKKIHDTFGGKLRQAIVGGARMDPDMIERMLDAGFPIFVGYGLTETSPVSTFGEAGKIPRGSVGKAIPGVEIRIHEPNAEGRGQILIRGPNVMKGYFRDPERTAEALAGGWFWTGDEGYVDPEGHLFLTGRMKEMIVTHGGKKLFPEDLERQYAGIPHVKEFCVVGQATRDGQGEEPVAVIVADRDAKDAPKDPKALEKGIRKAFADRTKTVPAYQAVKNLVFMEAALPKTTTMKVKRMEVARLLASTEAAASKGLERRRKERPDVSVMAGPAVDSVALARLLASEPTTAGRKAERLRAAVDSSPVVFSVWAGGELVGFTRALSDGVFTGILADLVVAPAWRRKGIGSLLLSRVLADPKIQPLAQLVVPGDAPAEFLARFGFKKLAEGFVRAS
jgi:long-chain acyl-CoA synthetase